jgi:hypothetical protein
MMRMPWCRQDRKIYAKMMDPRVKPVGDGGEGRTNADSNQPESAGTEGEAPSTRRCAAHHSPDRTRRYSCRSGRCRARPPPCSRTNFATVEVSM